MVSEAKTVSEYLKTVPPERLEALKTIRKLCLEYLEGYDEVMDYGLPGYKRNGIIEVGFASQKNFIALYILKQEAMITNKNLLQGLSMGKGCIRYPNPKKINFDMIKILLQATNNSDSHICGPVIK